MAIHKARNKAVAQMVFAVQIICEQSIISENIHILFSVNALREYGPLADNLNRVDRLCIVSIISGRDNGRQPSYFCSITVGPEMRLCYISAAPEVSVRNDKMEAESLHIYLSTFNKTGPIYI